MFTGLIQKIGQVARMEVRAGGARLTVRHTPWDQPLAPGESVAVQGACLTVSAFSAEWFTCDVLGETLNRTNLGGKRTGAPLNLERALRSADRLGGHIVTGHVDGTGCVQDLGRNGADWVLRVRCGGDILGDIAVKGSVACDGVSLTVAGVDTVSFRCHLIPTTLAQTTLASLRGGDRVNIETDVLAKYVRRAGSRHAPTGRSLELEDLRNAGFA